MNYTKAADILSITQPAVSQHIHYLESQYGCKLFTSEGKKVCLTHAGEILLRTATTLQNDEHHMKELMAHPDSSQAPLIFGTTMTIGEFVMSSPIASLIRRKPEISIHMVISNTANLVKLLKNGEINFAVVEGYFPQEEFDTLTFRKESFIAVCGKTYDINKKEIYELDELFSHRLLLRENGSGTREILEKILNAKNYSINNFACTTELNSMHVIRSLLLEDCGISFVYKSAVKDLLDTDKLIQLAIADYSMEHKFTCIWNKGSIFAEEYKNICTILKETTTI